METISLPQLKINEIGRYNLKSKQYCQFQLFSQNHFVYCESGRISIKNKQKKIALQSGEALFLQHLPEMMQIDSSVNSSLFYLGFDIDPATMKYLKNRTVFITVLADQNRLLTSILAHFSPIVASCDKHFINCFFMPKDCLNGQLIFLHFLEFVLLTRHQQTEQFTVKDPLVKRKNNYSRELVNEVVQFMEENLHLSLTVTDLSEHFFVSPTTLKKIFKEDTGYGLINYFRILKMEQAKEWVKTGYYNFTEIASLLGFTSIHHFSRTFKKYVGFNPTAYQKQVQSIEQQLDSWK